MSSFDEKYGLNRTFGEDNYEYYEDTHDNNGQYFQRLKDFTVATNNNTVSEGREDSFTPRPNNIVNAENVEEPKEKDEEKEEQKQKKSISFKNVMVYEPTVEKEAQAIINCLKTGEPIILKMDETDEEVAQRVLDFVAGAIYALDGLIKKISTDVFLAVPPFVQVIIPEGEEK
ncbi:MAG: cell division protein SepF [Clostridiales bacterium]|nr:cell division protein SepF [Clostridiales bacterium]